MPSYVLILVFTLALCASGVVGYYLGRHMRSLIDEIRTLKEQKKEEPKPEPTVTMGVYTPPQEVSTATDDRAVGLVESKTPELVEWEQEQAIEREGRGFGRP